MGGNFPIFINRPIRLADVLRAQDKVLPFRKGYMGKMTDTVLKWNLRADDLEKQSEQTIDFLHELLN
jgi:hypothetical protein